MGFKLSFSGSNTKFSMLFNEKRRNISLEKGQEIMRQRSSIDESNLEKGYHKKTIIRIRRETNLVKKDK